MVARSRALGFAGLVVVAAAADACGKAPIATTWHDLPTGEALARAQHKPAVLFFGAAWSAADVEMERTTFADAEVQRLLRDFVAIKVDMTDDEDRATTAATQRFGVRGDPTTLVVASFDQYPAPRSRDVEVPRELYRGESFVPAPEFARVLRKAKLDFEGK